MGGILFQFFLRYHTNFLICPTSRKGKKRSQLNPRSLLSVGISPRLEILEFGGQLYIGKSLSTLHIRSTLRKPSLCHCDCVYCGVVFFTSPFHLGGRHARPFTQ